MYHLSNVEIILVIALPVFTCIKIWDSKKECTQHLPVIIYDKRNQRSPW